MTRTGMMTMMMMTIKTKATASARSTLHTESCVMKTGFSTRVQIHTRPRAIISLLRQGADSCTSPDSWDTLRSSFARVLICPLKRTIYQARHIFIELLKPFLELYGLYEMTGAVFLNEFLFCTFAAAGMTSKLKKIKRAFASTTANRNAVLVISVKHSLNHQFLPSFSWL